jgi:Domain of unknown function (DUF4331)
MSSHREAPEISKDPVADNTDVYAFVSPERPDTVTLIANYIPMQQPYGGPNFYEFGDDVLYEIHISNSGTARADISYQFRFTTKIINKETFLYNTGPISSITDTKNWNRPQYYSVTRMDRQDRDGDDDDDDHSYRSTVLASGLTVPPVNVGVRSTPNYANTFTKAAIHDLGHGRRVFAGQRAEGFHVDLGSIFDLAVLRLFEFAHLIPSAMAMAGVNGTQGVNVHSIAIQVPISDVTRHGRMPHNVADTGSVIGVWASASRRKSKVYDNDGKALSYGPYQQVSRLGNPLFNEVIVPMAEKDLWNALAPYQDSRFAKYVLKPELARLLPVLYPTVFPKLAGYSKPRFDLQAILLSGIPNGIVPGFQNYTGPVLADLLRLNVAVPPSKTANPIGLIAGDAAGFPNGRRVTDDVVAIELRAIAGATIPLVDKAFTPDAAAAALTDGTTNTNAPYLDAFPYLGTPAGGYQTKPAVPAV